MTRLFTDVPSLVDDRYLSHAAALARRASGRTWPNPVVGCVVVRDGSIVGEGFHPRAGEPHAEIFALADAGADARGATAYVTLEPCSHHGRTPPCVDALLVAGVAKVVIGMRDPNAEAAGGAERLTAAGIEAEFASDPRPFSELNAGWLKRLATGRPRVTVKLGMSLDGSTSFTTGERAAITGPSGAEVTRMLRARTDAVLVSAATVIADDPALTVRDARGAVAEHQPVRVVLARTTLPPADARVFTDGAAPTMLLVSDAVDTASLGGYSDAVQLVRWSADGGFGAALDALGAHGVGELLVEAGPRLFSAMWESGGIDELVCVTAGGAAAGPPVFVGTADRDGERLIRRMRPLEAGIVGDVSVTLWGAHDAPDVE